MREIRHVTGMILDRLVQLEQRIDRYFTGVPITPDAASAADDVVEVFPIPEEVAERFEIAVRRQTMRARTVRVSVLEWTNGFVMHYRNVRGPPLYGREKLCSHSVYRASQLSRCLIT